MDEAESITRILSDPSGVSAEGASALTGLVYEQLRRAAAEHLRGERPGHTLQPTALVHEAFVRLAGPREIPWASRAHYYSAAAEAMRRILIDHARSRGARRSREASVTRLVDVADLASGDPGRVLAVDEALSRLEREDPEAAAMVRLRFFAGLSVEEASRALGVSSRTGARLWALARARLHRWLSDAAEGGHDE